MVAVTINLVNDDTLNSPIINAAIGIYTTNAIFVTSSVTDSFGNISISLPAATYRVYVYKIGVSLQQPQILIVSNSVTMLFRLIAHERSLPESIDPELIRVSGYIYDSTQKPKKNFYLNLNHEYTQLNRGDIIANTPVSFYSDDNGYYEFDLYRNMSYLYPYLTQRPLIDVRTPDRSAIRITDLLFYIPVLMTTPSNTYTIALNQSINIPFTIVYTDYSNRGLCSHWSDITYSVDNTNLYIAPNEEQFTVTGLARGTTHLTFNREIKKFLVWKNSPAFISPTITITVT